jgi:hypothetical protein
MSVFYSLLYFWDRKSPVLLKMKIAVEYVIVLESGQVIMEDEITISDISKSYMFIPPC